MAQREDDFKETVYPPIAHQQKRQERTTCEGVGVFITVANEINGFLVTRGAL